MLDPRTFGWEVYYIFRTQLAGGTEPFTGNSHYFSPLFFCEAYTAIDIYASYRTREANNDRRKM